MADAALGHPMPTVAELLASARVVALPMRVRFRGIRVREAVVFQGPVGWGEFAPFPEYADAEAALWLQAGIEAAYHGFPQPGRQEVAVNATVPAVPADQVAAVLGRFPGCTVAKVKVAEHGTSVDDDVARVAAVRAELGTGATIRVDANGAWDVPTAQRVLGRLLDDGPLDYAEQPCATVDELAELRHALAGACEIAADESIRRASDPLRVAERGAADVAVLKVAPLGGVAAVLRTAAAVAEIAQMRVTVSSALDTAVGISAGIFAAAALPDGNAAGLATGNLFLDDLGRHRLSGGALAVQPIAPSLQSLSRLQVSRSRRDWWLDRLRRCAQLLGAPA